MDWITRQHPKIDRIACPWLIKNFVDKHASFHYVPKDQVFDRAEQLGGIPYDIDGAEYSHYGDQCSFDYIVSKHQIDDPAVKQLALIVRAADTDRFELAPQAAGLWAFQPGYPIPSLMTIKCSKSASKFMMRFTHGQSIFKTKSILETLTQTQTSRYSLADLTKYFLKLGTLGFGGPVALIGYMHRDLVEDKKWISEDEYREGLALAQLAPGPLAAQLGIYLGYVHYGVWGATLTGLAFVLPSFIMVVLLGMAYKLYGGLPWMQSVFYGVGAAVIGIISLSCYKLTIKSISKIEPQAIKSRWLLWLFFLTMAIVTAITQREEVWLFILLGFIYMVVKAPPKWLQRRDTSLSVILLAGTGFWQYEPGELVKLGLFFTEAGAFVFGSGLAIIPFLQAGVVKEMGWLSEQQFLDSVAVAMITPGPVVITVGFIGFLVSGFAGAVVAALGVFVPCFVFTVLPAPYFKKISKNSSIKAFVDGITAAVVGALVGSVFVIATRSIVDAASALIAIITILALIYIKKLQEPYIILAAAIVGFCIKTYL